MNNLGHKRQKIDDHKKMVPQISPVNKTDSIMRNKAVSCSREALQKAHLSVQESNQHQEILSIQALKKISLTGFGIGGISILR